MKIALLNNSLAWGGLEINVLRLSKWLKQEGNETFMICPENTKIATEAKINDIPTLSFTHQTLKRGNIFGARKIFKQLKKENIKHIIIGHSRDINLAVFIKCLSRATIKITYLQQMRIGVNKRDLLHSFFYKRLDAWVAPLPYLKENTLQRTKIKEDKIFIIPLGIETDKFTEEKNQTEARKKFNLPLNVKIAGIIGRIDHGKGQEYLISALSEVRKKGFDLHIMLLGEETKGDKRNYLKHLKALTKQLMLDDFVHFRPFTKETAMAFASLDIFVTASLEETYGMVTIEAMASKLPVIGVNNYGTKDLIEDNRTGLYCLSENANSIANQLIYLLKNPDKAKEIAKNAQETVVEKYSHKVQTEAIVNLLKHL